MTLTVLTPAQQSNLTTLAQVKTALGITDPVDDWTYAALIPQATSQVQGLLGYPGIRREVRDRFRGMGFSTHSLEESPLVELGTIQLDGSTIDQTDNLVSIESAPMSIIRRSDTFSTTQRPLWTVEYWAGWLVPGDDFSSAAITFANSGQTLTLSSGTWPLLVANDRITLSGATNSENSGTFTVSARTSDTVLTLDSASGIVDEAEGQTITVNVSNLPDAIDRAVTLLVRDAFQLRGSTSPVEEERVGSLQVKYASTQSSHSGGVSREVRSLLQPYRRVSA